jgi:hypothetical protein
MDDPRDLVERLRQSVDDHDLDALVGCFSDDYVNETPAHPGRGFTGNEQVRTNWARLFAGVPDMRAEVLATAVHGSEVWSEWEMRGTRPDGETHLMRGVIIFGITGGRAERARFYLEPVDAGEGGVDGAISGVVEPERRP